MEIIHIPDKPPISPDQQPTVEVFAASIQPKLAHTLIKRLNQIAPLESVRHVKRVRKKNDDQPTQGNSELWVILCLASSQDGNESCCLPHEVQELVTTYNLTIFRTEVCKYAATSKEEWEEQCKLWPTSFHPPTYNIDGITGFSNEDSESIFGFMNEAIQLAKSAGGGSVVNAAVIVDPSIKQIVSRACDQTCSWHTPTDENPTETNCLKQQETIYPETAIDRTVDCQTQQSNGLSRETEESYSGVSCLYPWGLAEQQPHLSSRHWHPLRHAAIVAIEYSAARDRHLFPGPTEIPDESTDSDNMKSSFLGSPAKRQKTNVDKVNGEETVDSRSQSTRPYLCTGYDIFLVWEPCPMCAMALVHQRIRRIFFAFPNPNTGALGSVYRLQGERSLNHHYAVFRVLMPEPVFDASETRASKSTDKDSQV